MKRKKEEGEALVGRTCWTTQFGYLEKCIVTSFCEEVYRGEQLRGYYVRREGWPENSRPEYVVDRNLHPTRQDAIKACVEASKLWRIRACLLRHEAAQERKVAKAARTAAKSIAHAQPSEARA